MPYTIKPGSFKYKKSNGQFSEIDCFEGPDLTEEVAALEKGKAPIIIDSATGNPITIKDGADGLSVEGMKIHFGPIQSGTGDPSPSNIRPISGFDGINIFRTGINIWDEELELGGINSSTGQPYAATSALRAKNYIPVVPGAKYYFKSSSVSTTRCWYDKDKNYISTGYVVNMEITAPDNAYFFRFDLPSSYGTTYNDDISLNYPSTDTEYHPYTGQSYPVTFPVLGKNLCNGVAYSVNISNDIPQVLSRTPITSPFTTTYNYSGVGFIAKVNANITYALSSDATGANEYFYCGLYASLDDITDRSDILQYATTTETFTPIADGYLVFMRYSTSLGTEVTWSYAQCEEGSTATTYEPYMNVNGGTLNVINGVLKVEWKAFNLGALGWVYADTTNYRLWYADNDEMDAESTDLICEKYIPSNDNSTNNSIRKYTTGSGVKRVSIHDNEYNEYTTSAQIKTALNGVYYVSKIGNPYEIQLDQITVQTLLGNNTIWSDANGAVELDYRTDTKLFCQKNDQVNDVQINGASILDAQGVANVPIADANNLGVVMPNASGGIDINPTTNKLRISNADNSQVRSGTDVYKPITPAIQHSATFYGLAKVAGADMASSSNPVGQFTDEAKSKISDMLNAPVSVSGTTPVITGQAGLRYICGECATLSITAPASGCIDIVFKSGSTPTVLTVASTKVNTTIKWMDDFDPDDLDADTTYELNILDGEFGVVAEWT